MQKSVRSYYTFRSIPFRTALIFFVVGSRKHLKFLRGVYLKTFFHSMMGRAEHVTKKISWKLRKFKENVYLHFTAKRFVHDILSFNHSCISVWLMQNPACFSLLFLIFNDCFTPLVFLGNKHSRHKSQNMLKVKMQICRGYQINGYQKLIITCKEKWPRYISLLKRVL